MARQRKDICTAGKVLFPVLYICLVAVFCFGLSGRDSFGTPSDISPGIIKEVPAPRKTRIVIKNITIEDPRIVVRIEGSKKTGESVLDRMPAVVSGKITNGSAEIVLTETHQTVVVQRGNISVRNFTPERGGKMVLSGAVHYELHDKKNIGIDGSASASLDMSAFKPAFAGTGYLTATIDRGSYGPVSFDNLSAKVPFTLHEDEIALKTAEFALGRLKNPSVQKTVDIRDIRFGGDIVYAFRSRMVSIRSLKGSTPQTGEFKGSLTAVLRDPLNFRGSIVTPALDLAKINETVKTYLPPDYRGWSAQGKADAQTDFDGTYSQKALIVRGRQAVTVSGGGLGSRDGTKAAQGVGAHADITFSYASAPERLSFALKSNLTGGEFLWGTYYRDFSGNTVQADASGNFSLTGERTFSFNASTDLFGAGSFRIAGSGHKGEQIFSVDAKDISMQKLNALFLEDYLKQNFPTLAGASIEGSSSIRVNVRRKSPQTDLSGVITADVSSLTVPAQKVSISGVHLNLPFDLGYPKASSPGKVQQGLIEIKSAEKDRIRTRDVHIPLLLWNNKLRLPEGAAIHIARGDVMISNFEADDILSPDRKISCGLRINNVSLRPIQRSFTITPITGTISAYYPRIEYSRDALTAGGSTQVDIFGGEVEIGIISIQRLSAASRKIDTDISFKNINLEKVTGQIAVGKMTGIIQGSISGFEMEYGQPTRFVLDIDSVDTKGVSQRISVEAIQSISILGTGSGMSGVLNRGILSFFKDYPYSAIGIHATLSDDVFTVRGKIHSGGTEYLVKRGFLRGVDVVNQNPDNKISFKDMQERLKRIFEARKSGGAPVVQ